MEYDQDKVDELALALLHLTSFTDECRPGPIYGYKFRPVLAVTR